MHNMLVWRRRQRRRRRERERTRKTNEVLPIWEQQRNLQEIHFYFMFLSTSINILPLI